MSKHLFSFLLTELDTVRICCQSCHTIVEMPLKELAALKTASCTFCHHSFDPTYTGNALVEFGAAVAKLQGLAKVVAVEFALPVKE